MTCSNCQAQLPEDAKVCSQCGTVLEIPEAAPEAAPAPEKKKLPKAALIGIIAAAAVALVLVLALIFAGGGAPNYLVYVSDGDTFMAFGNSYKPVAIADEDYSMGSYISKDGKKVLLRDEDGALCYYTVGSKKDPVELASSFENVYCNEDFTVFTYTKDGALYQCNAKGKPVKGDKKIQGKVSDVELISPDANIIYYTSTDEDSTLYVKVGKKDAEEIAKGNEINDIIGYGKDFKSVYYLDEENNLMKKQIGKKEAKLAEDVLNVYGFANKMKAGKTYNGDGTFYFVSGEMDEETSEYKITLNYFDGKKVVSLTDSFTCEEDDWGAFSTRENALLFYTYEEKESGESERQWTIAVGAKAAEWDEEIASLEGVTRDAKYIYYTDKFNEDGEGDVYRVKFALNPGEPKLVDEDVYDTRLLANGDLLCYKEYDSEKNEASLYLNKKLLAEDVSTGRGITAFENGDFFFYTDYNAEKSEATLCLYNGKVKTIAEDVKSAEWMADGALAYLTNVDDNGEGDLYVVGKKKAVASEVSDFGGSYMFYQWLYGEY